MSDVPPDADDEIIVETGEAGDPPPLTEDERPADLDVPTTGPVPEDERVVPEGDPGGPAGDGPA